MNIRIIIGLGLCVFVSVALLVVSCRDSQVDELLPSGTLDEYQGCKEWTTGIETGTDAANNQDCIEYAYDGRTLILKHVNAGFNCCIPFAFLNPMYRLGMKSLNLPSNSLPVSPEFFA